MSDKSFGDHTNKNVVKNPLLSTAVTGLSLDELTQKAVLLPVSPTLGLTARPEQTGPQNVTLGNTQQETSKSSGDAVTLPTKSISEPNKNFLDNQRQFKTDDTQKTATVTQSKASAKSEDDFDVNEYIARLQGTRYVSAPLHSHIKEDQNANLDTTEENLEEINLNESQNVEVQQSLTADLKQNFSQLPTVLPHVANAVFNSFSNMLNLRSRDQTPEVDNQYQRNDNNQGVRQGYQGTGQVYPGPGQIQGQFQGSGVPLMAEEKPVKELAPPPREPPVLSGPSNFRLPTKKKYAQIPGLSTGEAQAMPYNPPAQNTSSFFTPPSHGIGPGVTEKENVIGTQGQSGIQAGQSVPSVFTPHSYGIPHGLTENISRTQAGQRGTQDGQSSQASQNVQSAFTPPSYGIPYGVTENISGTQVGQNTTQASQSGTQPGQSAPSVFTPHSYGIPHGLTESISSTQVGQSGTQAGQNVPSYFIPSTQGFVPGVTRTESISGTQASQSVPFVFTPPSYGVTQVDQSGTQIGQSGTQIGQSGTQIGQIGTQAGQSVPSFFIPPSYGTDIGTEERENNTQAFKYALETQETKSIPSFFTPSTHGVDVSVKEKEINSQASSTVNIFNPADTVDNSKETLHTNVENTRKIVQENETNIFTEKENKPVQQFGIETPQCNTQIIPPPPMFSSLRRDSATGANVGKAVLPPSVARRISANQPIIKPQNVPMTLMDKIFVPEFAKDLSESQSKPLQSDSPAFLQPNQTLPQALITSAPSSGPTFFNPSNQPHVQQIALPPQPSQQSDDITKPSDFSSTSGTQIFNPIPTQITETSQSTGVPLFFTPSDKTATSAAVPSEGFGSTTPTSSTMFTPSSPSSTLFNPAPQEPIEKPKPPIEPPKATGTNFRMTKKRPQYYSGPIEGVGSISNNVKPAIPMATPLTDYQASLFTPEPIKPEEIPVDNSIPTLEAYSLPKESTFSPPAPETSVTAFDISQPHQYTPEYNTAFDLSRATTDAYEDPKPESKGFGIIGSLKSKLSSIDINKIQSSVTTFFDPAYNETKKVESNEGQHAPYGQGQSNFDMYVPSIQNQSQYDYQSGYGYNQYYQPNYSQNVPVNYSQNEAQNTSVANYFTDPNYSQYVPEHSTMSYASNIPENTNINANQNVNMYFDSNMTAQAPPTHTHSQEKYEKEMNNANILQTSIHQVEGTEIKRPEELTAENVALLPKPDVITTLDQHIIKDDIAKNNNIDPQESYSNNAAVTFFNTLQTEIFRPPHTSGDDPNFGQTSSFNLPPSSNFFDYPQTSKEDLHVRDVNPDIVEDTLKQVPTNQIQSSIAYPGTDTSFFDSQNTTTDDLPKSLYGDGVSLSTSVTQSKNNYMFSGPSTFTLFDNQQIRNEEFDNQQINVAEKLSNLAIDEKLKENSNIGSKELEIAPNVQNIQTDVTKDLETKDSTILQSISKADNIPFIGVSTAPLFGLSAMLADKSKEMDSNKSSPFDTPQDYTPTILGATSNTSFFENVAERQIEQKDLTGLSITDVKNVLLIEPPQENICAVLKRNASSNRLLNVNTEPENIQSKDEVTHDPEKIGFFDHLASEELKKEHSVDPSELSICETCREVNSPVDKEVDLTSQLIDNITSRIQLSNAVEVPLREKRVSDGAVENTAIDDQRAEITNITEDTIETLQAQSATELLDDAPNANFGWTTQSTYSSTLHGHDYSFDSQESYGFKLNTNTENQQNIGFDMFYDNTSLFFHNMPKNASDEIKAEFKTSKDDIIPARQMSIPSAPPAEEDSKSETGLDVHSIEQDANKDFPIEEEFVIEPSETDDDKIETRERKKTPELGDTFTNRVERFQKATDFKETPDFSAPKSMASYFDTGNYAVESHYKNSLTSPRSLPITDLTRMPGFVDQTKVPGFGEQPKTPGFVDQTNFPGFEDHRSSSGFSGEPNIPDTSTQTGTSSTCTFIRSDSGNQDRISFADTKNNLPPFTQVSDIGNRGNMSFNDKTDNIPAVTELFGPKTVHEDLTTKAIVTTLAGFDEKKDNLPPFTEIFGAKAQNEPIEIVGNTHLEIGKHEKVQSKGDNAQLPDPMNFFSSTIDESKPETADYNRLASYFSTPAAKLDHSKSFFELSQSQNHYRHPFEEKHANSPPKPFDLTQSENHHLDQTSRANIADLMRDLTSPQNIKPEKQVVTTVNYFTVELDNKNELNNLKTDTKELKLDTTKNPNNTNTNFIEISNGDNKHDSPSKNDEKTKLGSKKTKKIDIDTKVKNIIINCRRCNVNTKEFRVRQCTNDTESKKDGDIPDMQANAAKKLVNSEFESLDMDENMQDGVAVVEETRSSEYTPVRHHWFYRVDVEDKSVWRGFSVNDSRALEEAFNSPNLNENTLVPTDGGRFDVNVVGRLRIAVYWKEKPTNVRRCSWFYKGTTDARYVPYTEAVADKLEEEYRHGITTGEWHRRLVLPNNEIVIMHGPTVMVHFLQGTTDAFSTPAIILLGKRVYRNPPKIKVVKDQPQTIDHLVLFVHGAGEYKREQYDATSRPRVVRRGHEESEIEEASPTGMDHLLLLCHGVGSACDMRFRSVEEVVEDFRATSLQLVQSHYKNSYDNGVVNRVEVLPISWHAQLHSGEAGVDSRLSRITLDSIPRLRAFTNHTVLDVLFYTSPVYHQTIIETVCFELNRIYSLFKARNPSFKGGVSLGGHSLGSVILYDLLCHQRAESPVESKSSAEKTYLPGITNNLRIDYPVLEFHPDALYALGSPIAIFECIRGVESLGLDFCLPTCKNFFNIFHPYDPIAYRIEPLINPQLQNTKPFLIPHHKGRKRMHLELKDTMARVGADLKQKLLESLRTTWNKWKATPPTDGQLEKVVEEELEKEQLCEETKEEIQENIDWTNPETLGRLNGGRRVDYVLQEAPLEMINEYLFAMTSHVGYWESEDTMLLILREIYSSLGVQPDSTVPQQSMTVHRTRKLDEATVVNEKEYPSTSRGGVN